MKDLLTALIKAKGEFKSITKNAENPFFHSKYSTLDHILECIEKALFKNGLILSQPVSVTEKGIEVTSILYHADTGEKITSTFLLPESKKIQESGSSITYARRYTLSSLLCLSVDEDDDGNTQSNSNNRTVSKTGEKWKELNKEIINSKTVKELKAVGDKIAKQTFDTDTADFLRDSYKEKLTALEQLIKTPQTNGR